MIGISGHLRQRAAPGLSLRYDIITKKHGGTIKVESKEGERIVFTIYLPTT